MTDDLQSKLDAHLKRMNALRLKQLQEQEVMNHATSKWMEAVTALQDAYAVVAEAGERVRHTGAMIRAEHEEFKASMEGS